MGYRFTGVKVTLNHILWAWKEMANDAGIQYIWQYASYESSTRLLVFIASKNWQVTTSWNVRAIKWVYKSIRVLRRIGSDHISRWITSDIWCVVEKSHGSKLVENALAWRVRQHIPMNIGVRIIVHIFIAIMPSEIQCNIHTQCWKLGQFAKHEPCENWLDLQNSCVYFACPTRTIHQVLPHSMFFHWVREYLENVELYFE